MRKCNDWLKTYMEYSGHSESPDEFHFWTAVSMVAGAVRRCVEFKMGYFNWSPNFYIIFVAQPGIVSKSTTADIGARLLQKVPDVNMGPSSVTWQRLVQAFAESREMVEYTDKRTGEIKHRPMSAMTFVSSELGNLLKPSDRDMVDMLIELWDARTGNITKSTKTQGDDTIENPWINIIACTTPNWIADNFPESMITGGFTSRCIWVYGEQKRKLVAYPGLVMPDGQERLADDLINDLEHISKLRGTFEMTDEAAAWGEIWYEDLHRKVLPEVQDEGVRNYLARKQTHLHKLAMILALSASDELIIDTHHLEIANTILLRQEADIPKVFAKIGLTPETQAVQQLLTAVLHNPGLDLWKLYGLRFSRSFTQDRFNEIYRSLTSTGFIHSALDKGGNTILWPTRRGYDFVKSEGKEDTSMARILSGV